MSIKDKTVEVLCKLLQTGDEVDRCYAARALGVIGDQTVVSPLIDRLRDEDLDVCIDAATALGNIGAIQAVPALIESLENDSSGEICTAVTEALGKTPSKQAIGALLNIFRNRPPELEWDDDWDTWWDIQLEAVKAFGKLQAEQSLEDLARFIDDESEQDIENEILKAMVSISDNGVEKVIQYLLDRRFLPRRRRRAARALAFSRSPETTKALGKALKDQAADVRAEAALSLAVQGAENYFRALLLMLRDSNEQVRQAAVKAIVKLARKGEDSKKLQMSLSQLLTDPDSQVRAVVMTSLSPLVENSPLPENDFRAVIESLNDKSTETVAAASKLLGLNGDDLAIDALLDVAKDDGTGPLARREAILSLGRLGRADKAVIDVLVCAVTDRQQAVRLAALTALKSLQLDTVAKDVKSENGIKKPLEYIIDAVNGNIAITDTGDSSAEISRSPPETAIEPTDESVAGDKVNEQVLQFMPEAGKNIGESAAEHIAQPEPLPESLSGSVQLPQSRGEIIEPGELASAASTLQAIAMDNVEKMMGSSLHDDESKIDESTQEYLDIVAENEKTVRRLRSNRRISTEQDVRRLGARVLAEFADDRAIATLTACLSDADEFIRREAAEALAATAQDLRMHPQTADAVGILITQLAMGDIELKVSCAKALGNLGNRTAILPLMEALAAPETTIRVQAIESLANLTVNGLDAKEADHMVVRAMPPISVAKKIVNLLDDREMGVRVAAAKTLPAILEGLKEPAFYARVLEKVIDSAASDSGEEARLIGKTLRAYNRDAANELLLSRIRSADNSVRRSVYIEMVEELLNPGPINPDQRQAETAT